MILLSLAADCVLEVRNYEILSFQAQIFRRRSRAPPSPSVGRLDEIGFPPPPLSSSSVCFCLHFSSSGTKILLSAISLAVHSCEAGPDAVSPLPLPLVHQRAVALRIFPLTRS